VAAIERSWRRYFMFGIWTGESRDLMAMISKKTKRYPSDLTDEGTRTSPPGYVWTAPNFPSPRPRAAAGGQRDVQVITIRRAGPGRRRRIVESAGRAWRGQKGRYPFLSRPRADGPWNPVHGVQGL